MLKYALPQFRNLWQILKHVYREVPRQISDAECSPSSGEAFFGFYIWKDVPQECSFWVSWSTPVDFIFAVKAAGNFDLDALKALLSGLAPPPYYSYTGSEERGERFAYYWHWDLEQLAFFSKNLEEQINIIQTIVLSSLQAAQASIKKSGAE